MPILSDVVGRFKGRRKEDAPTSIKDALKKEFAAEAESLKASVNDVVLHDKARQFFKLVRRSLEKLFSVGYECTYEELKKELESKVSDKKLKLELRVFLEELERFEYDFPDFEDEHRLKKAKEREEVMNYLGELESEGKKIDKNIRDEIDGLFKDDLSDASRLLIKYMNEFEELLQKI